MDTLGSFGAGFGRGVLGDSAGDSRTGVSGDCRFDLRPDSQRGCPDDLRHDPQKDLEEDLRGDLCGDFDGESRKGKPGPLAWDTIRNVSRFGHVPAAGFGLGLCLSLRLVADTDETEETALADLYRARFHFRLRGGQAGTQDNDPAGDVCPQQQDHDDAEGTIDRVDPAEVGQIDREQALQDT
jgi:hypothetical protein